MLYLCLAPSRCLDDRWGDHLFWLRELGIEDGTRRDSDEELRLQLEATQRLTTQDRELVKRFINGLLLSHEAKRLAA
jgi:hypothetical protein